MLTEKPGDDRQHRQPAELGHISDARALEDEARSLRAAARRAMLTVSESLRRQSW
jgi:hypothetical protein